MTSLIALTVTSSVGAQTLQSVISETLHGGVTVDGWGVASTETALSRGVFHLRIPSRSTIRRAVLITATMAGTAVMPAGPTGNPRVVVIGAGATAQTLTIEGMPTDSVRSPSYGFYWGQWTNDVTAAVQAVYTDSTAAEFTVPVAERGDRSPAFPSYPYLLGHSLVVEYENSSAPLRNVVLYAGAANAGFMTTIPLPLPSPIANNCPPTSPRSEPFAASLGIHFEWNVNEEDQPVRVNGMLIATNAGGSDDSDSPSTSAMGIFSGLTTTGSFGGADLSATSSLGSPVGLEGDNVLGLPLTPVGRLDDELYDFRTIIPDGSRTLTFAYSSTATADDQMVGSLVLQTLARDSMDDADRDGVSDTIEGNCTVDTDTDGTPDYLDLDSDNDCLLDSAPTEAGAARTNPLLPNVNPNNNCADPTPVCNTTRGLCIADSDGDGDGIPNLTEVRIGTDPMNPDSDGDGLSDGAEVGPGPTYTPLDTDMDGMINPLDTDDDGDGVPTATELGAGGPASPRNTDASVPAGSGASDTVPDYLDRDDDGDGIPTAVERTLEGSLPPDTDSVPAYLDLDSDGDGVPDSVEAGATPATPANSDGATDDADFLDLDSDNDCLPDSAATEAGAARTDPMMPRAMANSNCMAPTPVCNTTIGVCVNDTDRDGDGIPNLTEVILGTDPMNPDSDGDGLSDGEEVGPGPTFTAPDTDMDGVINALDPDDDGDGVPTAMELGAGGPTMPRNSDSSVPVGNGTSDTVPDYLDNDDDGDGVPTAVERTLDTSMMGDFDRDMTPSYLDLDSDGDGVPDSIEAGATPATPANTDAAMDGADLFDLDSDNDCVPDAMETSAGRTSADVPGAPDSNCTGRLVCDRTVGACVCTSSTMHCGDATPICDSASRACTACTTNAQCATASASAPICVMSGAPLGRCVECLTDSHCPPAAPVCNTMNQCIPNGPTPDASVSDAAIRDGSMDGGVSDASTNRSVLAGGGACGCRTPAAPSNAPAAMLALSAIAAVLASRRRR